MHIYTYILSIYIHTYLHTKYLVLQHLFCINIENHNYRGVFVCVCVCISEATINPVWFWSHISQDTNHHHPFIFCFHALYEEECSEFPNSFHKLFRTEHVKLEKIKANEQSISAGDVAPRVKAEGLCSLFWPWLGSDRSKHPQAQGSEIFGVTMLRGSRDFSCFTRKFIFFFFFVSLWPKL